MTFPSAVRSTFALLAVVVALSACGDGTHEAELEPALSPVTASLAEVRTLEIPRRIEVRGIVEAEKSAAVSSRVTAMVTALRVKAGDTVRRGQVLLTIDPATARGQLGQATGALAQAQAALSLAERNHERFEALARSNAASELELDMARMEFEQAKGAVEQASGAVEAARSVASESEVRAPFDGLVVRRMVDVGDLAAPGRPLMVIESVAGQRLSLSVPASVMARAPLAVGDAVLLRLDERQDLGEITGHIVERSPGADPMSHSFEVKVQLPAIEVASGGTGRARIDTDVRKAIVVPKSAIHRQGGLTLVVTLSADQRSESRVVTVGDTVDDDQIEVLSGLTGNETLLVGLPSLPVNGSPVEATS